MTFQRVQKPKVNKNSLGRGGWSPRASPEVGAIRRKTGVQPKLKVGKADDPAEREADQVADKIMRMPAPAAAAEDPPPPPSPQGGPNSIHRMCTECEEEVKRTGPVIRREADEDEVAGKWLEPVVRRVEAGLASDEQEVAGTGSPQPQSDLQANNPVPANAGAETQGSGEEADLGEPEEWELEALANVQEKRSRPPPDEIPPGVGKRIVDPSPGRPLSSAERNFMEPRFNADFSGVKIHDQAGDRGDAKKINARAFTYGNHIWLGPGENSNNRHLMAHELTHVVQQRPDVKRTKSHSFHSEAPVSSGPKIRERGPPGRVSRLFGWLSDAIETVGEVLEDPVQWMKEFIREYARDIPGYDLFAFVLGKDPLTDEPVERNGESLLKALGQLLPPLRPLVDGIRQGGILSNFFEWGKTRVYELGLNPGAIWDAVGKARDEMGITLGFEENLRILYRIFGPIIANAKTFAGEIVDKIIDLALEFAKSKFGGIAAPFIDAIRTSIETVKKIWNDPWGFIKNLFEAIKLGFVNFRDRIAEHLKASLFDLFFKPLAEEGIEVPDEFSFKSILKIALQIMGLTYRRIREKLIEKIGEKRVSALEKGFSLLKTLVTEGIPGVWQKIKELAGDLMGKIVDGVKQAVITELIKKAVVKLLSMFSPLSGAVTGVLAIYDVVRGLIDRAKQIAEIVKSFFGSIQLIATGKLEGAAAFIENVLANGLSLVIRLLAGVAGFGKIAAKVKEIIKKIRAPVDNALEKLIGFILSKAKAFLEAAREKAAAVGRFFKKPFTMSGKTHTLGAEKQGQGWRLMMESEKGPLLEKLDKLNADDFSGNELEALKTQGKGVEEKYLEAETRPEAGPEGDRMVVELAEKLQNFALKYNLTDLKPANLDKGELQVGSYSQMKSKFGHTKSDGGGKPKTPDHQPQHALLLGLKDIKVRAEGSLHRVFEGKVGNYSHSKGITLNMNRELHKGTRTYGSKGNATKKAALAQVGVLPAKILSNAAVKNASNIIEKVPGVADEAPKEAKISGAAKKINEVVQGELKADHTVVKALYANENVAGAEVETALKAVESENKKSDWGGLVG